MTYQLNYITEIAAVGRGENATPNVNIYSICEMLGCVAHALRFLFESYFNLSMLFFIRLAICEKSVLMEIPVKVKRYCDR
jgi:hypothetical protein